MTDAVTASDGTPGPQHPDAGPDGEGAAVPARPAASVILIRDGPDEGAGPEVFIQHRVSTMDFAAGRVVFPGGRVDAVDSAETVAKNVPAVVVKRHAQAWRRTGAADPAGAAGPSTDAVPLVGLEDAALRLLAAALREVLEETGLILDADALVPWANWVTPPDQPKRFDTYFFLAAVRPGQEPRHQTTEASDSQWMAVADILAADAAGTLRLMRPTRFLLQELLKLGSTAAALSAVRDIVPERGLRCLSGCSGPREVSVGPGSRR